MAENCPYNALRYTGDRRVPWLGMVYDRAASATPQEIVDWLRTSPWGRCVYRCDNDAVDRQVLALEFEGGITGTFTMTAFENGRHIEVYGTKGVLKGGETYRHHFGAHLVFLPHEEDLREAISRLAKFLEQYRARHAKSASVVQIATKKEAARA